MDAKELAETMQAEWEAGRGSPVGPLLKACQITIDGWIKTGWPAEIVNEVTEQILYPELKRGASPLLLKGIFTIDAANASHAQFVKRGNSELMREKESGRLKPWSAIEETKKHVDTYLRRGWLAFEYNHLAMVLHPGEHIVEVRFREVETDLPRTLTRSDLDSLCESGVWLSVWRNNYQQEKVIAQFEAEESAKAGYESRPFRSFSGPTKLKDPG